MTAHQTSRSSPASAATAPAVLHITAVETVGGTIRSALFTMRVMAEQGYPAMLACNAEGGAADLASEMGLRAVACRFDWMQKTADPRKLSRYIAGLRRESERILRLCRDQRIAILHPHGPTSALYAVKAARTLGLPMVYHYRDAFPPGPHIRLATRYFRRYITRAVCVSEVARSVAVACGVPEERTEVIHNALNNPAYLGPPPEPVPDIAGPGPHIALVGLIGTIKGQQVLLEAAERIVPRYPEVRIYLIGALCHPDDQPYLDGLRSMAERPPLKGHVVFTGERRDVPRWMAGMDVVALPSIIPESFGNVLIEAMALGRKVVASNIGGPLEIVHDGVTGLLVPPGDPDALAAALGDLIERPPSDPMGERARQDVLQRFSPEGYARRMAAVYESVLSQQPG